MKNIHKKQATTFRQGCHDVNYTGSNKLGKYSPQRGDLPQYYIMIYNFTISFLLSEM